MAVAVLCTFVQEGDEVRLQTLSSLVMLPRTIAYLAYSKTLGCLLGLIPALTCLCLGSLLLPGLNVNFVLQVLIAPLTWGIMLLVVVFLHLVAFLSLFVKWGALPLAVMTMAPMMTCCPVVQLVVTMTSRQGPPDLLRTLSATAVTWVLLGLVCFVFQMMIIARLEEIGAK